MLNIYALNKTKSDKEFKKILVYKQVLKICHQKIKTASEKSQSILAYLVPEYIIGIPKYDIVSCTEYIYNKLKQNGFLVKPTWPNLLFISWGHVKFDKEKSRQFYRPKPKAIMPAPTKQVQKPKRVYRRVEDFDEKFRNLNNFI